MSLDLTDEERELVKFMVKTRKTKTQARLMRQIIEFHAYLTKLREEGYLIQAIKGGSLLQFPDLVPHPEERGRVFKKTRVKP